MRLVVTTPEAIVVDATGVVHVRAEDETGAFGIEPRHADFLTALAVSVVSYRDEGGHEHHVAVRGGVLRVAGGARVEVATSEALAGDDLAALRDAVLARYRVEADAEATARTRAAKLHLLAMRGIHRFVRGEREGALPLGREGEEGGA
jgi:F-type H+-transporting ATPase subunit epsilon